MVELKDWPQILPQFPRSFLLMAAELIGGCSHKTGLAWPGLGSVLPGLLSSA